MLESIQKQIGFGINREVCFCLGNNKNCNYLTKLNNRYGLFGAIVPLEHPRYIAQYRSAQRQQYIDKYVKSFRQVLQ